MPYDDSELPEEYRGAYDEAVGLVESPDLYRAFGELTRDPDRWAKATEAGGEMLGELGVDVPGSVSVGFFEGKPNPLEWEPFRIVLTNCRTFKKRVGTGIQEATICLGISIVPTPINPRAHE